MNWELLSWEQLEYVIRLLVSAVCGMLIGLERERRSKTAGVRTHLIVALSAALMMLVSKYGFFDVAAREGISVDASRIAAGVVTAIGFLGVGVIFIRNENVSGVTTAAGLWATVGVGIAIGSGMYTVGVIATLLIVVMQLLLHKLPLRFGSYESCTLTVRLEAEEDVHVFTECLKKAEIRVQKSKARREADGGVTMTLYARTGKHGQAEEAVRLLREIPQITEIKFI